MSTASSAEKVENSFSVTDNMPRGLRECVHEYGFAIVTACMQAGVKDPRRIHQLVREIWDGARQPRQRRPRGGTLDWLLIQAEAQIGAAELCRVLFNAGLAIVPTEPTAEMLSASMSEVSNFDVRCTKQEKHRRRLKAAVRAGAHYLDHSGRTKRGENV